jgi:drug/metabolite transporter (DMT)-like permease
MLRTSLFGSLIPQMICCCRLPGLLCTSAAAQIAIGFSSIAVTAIAVCGVSRRSAEILSAFDGSARASHFRSRARFSRRELSLKMGVEHMWGKVMGMTPTARGIVEMTIAMVISGTIGWVVVRSGQPLVGLIFWRCVFGAATLLIVCAGMGLLRERPSFRVIVLAVLGGTALVINWLLIFASFSRASISIATVVYNTQPFMLIVLGTLFFSERLTTTKLVWLAVSFAGLLLIADAKLDAHDAQTGYLSGVLMALGAAFFYAIAAVVAKKLAGTPPQLIALIQVCVGILILLPFAHLTNLPTGVTAWATLVTMGVVYTGLVFALLYGAIQKLPTHLVGALSFIYPLVAIGVDYLAFGKRLQLTQLIGAIAILVSAAGTTLGWSLPKSKSPGKTAQ